jgi:hypothetical protein
MRGSEAAAVGMNFLSGSERQEERCSRLARPPGRCYSATMPPRPAHSTRRRRTSARVSAAAARAVDAVLSSEEALALLVHRLEAAGWHVDRQPRSAGDAPAHATGLTARTRAR